MEQELNLFEFFKTIFGMNEKLDKIIKQTHYPSKKENKNEEEKPLTIDETYPLLRVSRSTLYRYCSEGRIKFYKGDKLIYFFRSDIDDFLHGRNENDRLRCPIRK